MPENRGLLTHAFIEAIEEIRDAAEFERLMLDDGAGPRVDGFGHLSDTLDILAVHRALSPYGRGGSALSQLKGHRACERLQLRYPEVWQRIELTEALDAS